MISRLIRTIGVFPRLKAFLKRIYSVVFFLLYRNKRRRLIPGSIQLIEDKNRETFFGYYDKIPINESGDLLLFHSIHKNADFLDEININVYEVQSQKKIISYTSSAWNWQQGSRLQWLSEDLFAYNDYDKKANNFIAKVKSVSNKSYDKTYEHAIQDAFKSKFFLSLNYHRLGTLRPDYGYFNKGKMSTDEVQCYNDDGIWLVNFETGFSEIIISIKSLVEHSKREDFEGAKHYVNHIMISPNGDRFIFLHRYFKNNIRYDRLYVSDLKGEFKLLADTEVISHLTWMNNEKLFGFLRGKTGQMLYHTIDIKTGNIMKYPDQKLQSFGDGHPSISGEYFATDTYPDKSQQQKLILGNLKNNSCEIIGCFNHSINYFGVGRCDLHPRLDAKNRLLFIDTLHFGRRQLCMIKVEDL